MGMGHGGEREESGQNQGGRGEGGNEPAGYLNYSLRRVASLQLACHVVQSPHTLLSGCDSAQGCCAPTVQHKQSC